MNAVAARTLSEDFLRGVREMPDGGKIDQCLQCGTCSASCPSGDAMDYGPRAILAALRAGLLDRVLQSNTVWLCASCYSCTVRCPAGIRFTDVMYELKRFGLERGLHRQGVRNAAMARAFVQGVDERGRSAEMPLLIRYILRAHRSAALSFLPLGWRLLRRGRIDFHPRGISQVEGLRRMMDAVGKEEAR